MNQTVPKSQKKKKLAVAKTSKTIAKGKSCKTIAEISRLVGFFRLPPSAGVATVSDLIWKISAIVWNLMQAGLKSKAPEAQDHIARNHRCCRPWEVAE